MSRLDYVTVGIVAVCLAALGFLVFKTVGLMNGNAETETQAATDYVDPYQTDTTQTDTSSFKDPAFSYTDEDPDDAEVSTYSEEDDRSKDIVSDTKTADKKAADSKTTAKGTTVEPKKKENVKLEATKPEATTKTPGTEKTTASKAKEPATKPKAKVTTPTRATESAESYAVQAGAFKARANAETLVKELKRLGYAKAEVALTKGGAMAVAVVDRFSNYDDAAALVKTLKSKHNIDALVKQK